MALPISVPYEDYKKLVKDSEDRANIVKLLDTEFPDDTCQLIAIKTILADEEVEVVEPIEPDEGEVEETP